MGRLALIREARNLETPRERLWLLATDRDRAVRAAAIDNLALELDRRALLLRAHEGKPLASAELEWLSALGQYGKDLAAADIATPDRVLLRLAREGHLKAVLKGRHIRDAAWFLEQARTDHSLLKVLSEEKAAGWPVRRQARNLLRLLPPPVATGEDILSPPLPASPGLPVPDPAAPPPTLRERLLNRKAAYLLDPQEDADLRSDPRLRRLAARHPYTPVRLLEWLDTQQPHGPARETLLSQLPKQPLDGETLRHFALHRDWELRAALAPNPALPLPLLELLARDADPLVRAASAEHPELSPTTLDRLAADTSVLVREAVAAHPSTPPEALDRLSGDEEWEVGLNVARNPSSDPETLTRLAHSTHAGLRETVAAHLLTGPDMLHELARDPNERVAQVARLRLPEASEESRESAASSKRRNVKLALATRPDASSALLLTLSGDRSSAVRALAGLHPGLEYGARQRLQGDSDPQVRRVAWAADSTASEAELSALPRFDTRVRVALSRNGSTPPAVLDLLSDDPQETVRSMVVVHPATPVSGLSRRLPELELRPLIRQHPRYQGALREQLHEQELHEAAQPDVAEDTLRALATSDSVDVRAVLARHARTPLDLQLTLTADPDPRVRAALLERAVVAEELQQRLVGDAAWEVQEALVQLPELAEGVMLALLKQPYVGLGLLEQLAGHPGITPAVVEAFAAHLTAQARTLAARHPLVSPAALTRLAGDLQEEVRQAVAAHPHCPPATLHRLAQRPEHRLAVVLHPSTRADTLESLAYDAGYARALRLPRTPKVFDLLRTYLLHRASQRAFPQMALLLGIIRHPHASARAIRYAGRLNHPEVAAAVLAVRASRTASTEPGGEHRA